MSQFGLLLVTDEATIRAACDGWMTPLDVPVKIQAINPFTGTPIEVTSYIPDNLAENPGRATLQAAHEALKRAKPISIDFQLHQILRRDFLDAAVPILIAIDDDFEGPVTIDRIPDALSDKVAEHFGEEFGLYADAQFRQTQNLAMFVLVYSF